MGIQRDGIHDSMSIYGQITDVILMNQRESVGQNPTAIVYFSSGEATKLALDARTVNINGQMVNVNPHKRRNR